MVGDGTLAQCFGSLPAGICLVKQDEAETILYVNDAFLKFYGCGSREEFDALTGGVVRGLAASVMDYQPLSDIVSDEERKDRAGAFHHNFVMKTRSGEFLRAEVLVHDIAIKGLGTVWILSLTDSSFYRTSAHVVVKGVLDRNAFLDAAFEMADREHEEGIYGSKAPVYLNIVNFTLFNSTYGFVKGDAILGACVNLLKHSFPGALIGYISADNFLLLADRDTVVEKLEHLASDVDHLLNNPAIRLKAGLCFPRQEDWADAKEVVFDRAKAAAASIRDDATRSWAVYTDSMGRQMEDEAYVLGNFHKALAEGDVKVYFQPVVRTLNGKLCSMEALSRWIDPVRGLLSPGLFVPVLEKSKLIQLLDTYVIEEVAKHLSALIAAGRPVVPVSVNLSRADFELMHPFDVVDGIVKKYKLPRSLIRIEVTESALVKDRARIQNEVDRFRHVGYECWLDDFGSAFSSLNVLHDFHFDELKIDMNFLRHFNDRSRKIIRSIILMSKVLGIHTLTEGVETKEQLEFLKDAGCEKIQGYYYGKPMPYDDLIRHMEETHIEMETPAEEMAYEKLGLVNMITDTPVGLFVGSGGHVRMIAVNRAYREALGSIGIRSLADINADLSSSDYPMQHRVAAFMDRLLENRTEESMTYIDSGNYLKLTGQILYGDRKFYVGKANFYNLKPAEAIAETTRLDEILRNILLAYDGIYYFHMDTQRVEVIQTMHPWFQKGDIKPLKWAIDSYFRRFIHEADFPRFLTFIDPSHVFEQAKLAGCGEAVNLFRTRGTDGSYRWKEFQCRLLARQRSKGFLLCIRDASLERAPARETLMREMLSSYGYCLGMKLSKEQRTKISFFDSLMSETELKFFWKDRQRRFLGASRAFLRYYGVTLEDILGKTDEDMGWNVKEKPFEDAEEKVLSGEPSIRFHGETVVKGEIRPISASKYPMYEGNKVVGFIGFFHDITKMQQDQMHAMTVTLTDPVTGLLGHRGMLMAGLQYDDSLRRHGEDYVGVLLTIPTFDAYCHAYGQAIHDPLLQELREIVVTLFPTAGTATYLESGTFLVLVKAKNAEGLADRVEEIKKEIGALKEAAGFPITLYAETITAKGSEAKNFDDFLHLLMRRLEVDEKKEVRG